MKPSVLSHKENFLPLLALFFLTLICYVIGLKNDFLMVDFNQLINLSRNVFYFTLRHSVLSQESASVSAYVIFRPLAAVFTYMLVFLMNDNTFFYHLLNILLFFILTSIFYWFVCLISKNRKFGFLSALMFCAHPMNSFSVNMMEGRGEMISLIFGLLSIIYYMLCLFPFSKPRYMVYSITYFILAVLTHELGLMIPVYVLLITFWFCRKPTKKVYFGLIPYFSIFIIYCALRWKTITHYFYTVKQYISEGPVNLESYIVSIVSLYTSYVSKLLSFSAIAHLWDLSAIQPLGLMIVILFILLGIAMTILAAYGFRKHLSAFAMIWFLIGFIPFLFLTFAYLPRTAFVIQPQWFLFSSFGFYMMLTGLILRFKEKHVPRLWTVVFLTIISLMAFRTIGYTKIFDHQKLYSLYWLKTVPGNALSKELLAQTYADEGQNKLALFYFDQALESGDYAHIYVSMGDVFMNMENYRNAKIYYDYALKLSPDNSMVFEKLGEVYIKLIDFDKAIENFNTAIVKDDFNLDAKIQLITLYLNFQDWKKSIDLMEGILEKVKRHKELNTIRGKLAVAYYKEENYLQSNHYTDLVVRELGPHKGYMLLNQLFKDLGESKKAQELMMLMK